MSQNTRYTETLPEAKKLKDKTLNDIEKLKVPANPVHFSLLYEKNSYVDPDLAREIELLIKNKKYTSESIHALYTNLLKKQICTALPTDDIKDLINTSLEDISSWTTESKDSRTNLDENIKKISQCTTEKEVLECIRKNIMPPINRLGSATQQLEGKLQESSETIRTLTIELEKATELAKTDTLTGLPNRRGFDQIMQSHINRAQEENQTFAMLIIDIDLFKNINDQYGHLVGDSVLRYLSRTLEDLTKGQDSVARYGGEEFVLILADINYNNAINFANNLRKAIENKSFTVQGQETQLKFTVCIGVSLYQMGETTESLFKRADKALYLAKESGRNQTRGEHQI